ncbi:DUF262 domain-containing protein [Planomonospora sp. ID82291]|uniref:DUF262 domain-containing protein n=1 Tax=Planomonospora sp. ID82291 TaxID=2738136 RepID=UPI0018C44973|nr:DUF262 domain-containing protein [Planomonospora sp. ID82291]MBG0813845.1 DUF262 domain-containing protein [Planomonospora sp. ID82291]
MPDRQDERGLDGPEEYAATGGEIGVRPDVNLLETFLDDVQKGHLRVPKFQRPFVWRPDQMLDLFDSIERGYPIGSMLLWDTPAGLESLGHVGGLRIPDATPGKSITYILDGHQRLSTLYACLYRPDADLMDDPAAWIWRVYRVLGEGDSRANRYVHWRKPGPPPANYLPVRSVLRTLDFLAYARSLAKNMANSPHYDELIEEGEQVAQRIKSYKVSVVTLLGGSLKQAVEVFSRVNSKGQSMSPDQMVSALTYKGQGEESLANSIAAILERIAGEGFGEINSTTGFRAVLAVAGEEEVTGAHWDVLARRVEGKVSQAVQDMDVALSSAVGFLRHRVGVPLARLIPYNNQLMLLTLFFHLCPHPSNEQIDVLIRWFWITSWAGQFASVNSTTSRQSIQDMRAFATGEKNLSHFEGGQGMFDFSDQRARPYPDRFDLRSARVRAYLLWELREFPVRYTSKGRPYEAIDAIRNLDTAAFRRVSNKVGLVNGSNPANRVILETSSGVTARSYLLDARTSSSDGGSDLGISDEAFARLADGDDEAFIGLRAAELARRERIFIESMGAVVPPVSMGNAEIDTE